MWFHPKKKVAPGKLTSWARSMKSSSLYCIGLDLHCVSNVLGWAQVSCFATDSSFLNWLGPKTNLINIHSPKQLSFQCVIDDYYNHPKFIGIGFGYPHQLHGKDLQRCRPGPPGAYLAQLESRLIMLQLWPSTWGLVLELIRPMTTKFEAQILMKIMDLMFFLGVKLIISEYQSVLRRNKIGSFKTQ